ncbi:MAG TPA: DUF1552 domain-containing protein [Vicinamibacterales bacterium]|nr:DUF1552 domain-containing protein [Vicinamibacterales bacterium]
MDVVLGKHLARRTFLRGLGASVALPFLDAMVPAFAAAPAPARRLGVVYVPNGMNMAEWRPASIGAGFDVPRTLKPLAPFKNRLVVFSGMANPEADPLPGEGLGDHSRAQAVFLTGAHPRKTEGADIRASVSADQIIARELGKQTELTSLELGLEAVDLVGGCEDGYACAYSGALAWRSETMPLPVQAQPRMVFERLFGASDSTERESRLKRISMERSILDIVTDQLNSLQKKLGAGDRTRITEYFESIRDIERRIQRAEEQNGRGGFPEIQQPGSVPDSFADYARLMFDLNVVAYQTDLTRVTTFLMGREKSGRTYPEIGVPDPHHPISHHQNRPEMLEREAKINEFHMQLFAHFLQKLDSIPDGDGTLLDHSLIVHGAGMSNSDIHFHHDLPILLAGGGAGQVRGGRHVKLTEDTPLANLWLTLIDKMGLAVEKFGDSKGRLDLISEV